MKSVKRNFLNKKLCYNTILILGVFFVLYVVLNCIYNKNKVNKKDTLYQKLNGVDRFANIVLNELPALTGNNLTNDNLSINEKMKIFYYNNLLNEATKNAITSFVGDEEIASQHSENIKIMLNNYNSVNDSLNDILQDLNGQLLSQLQKNYGTAHKLNIIRNIDNENIDFLPQRFS